MEKKNIYYKIIALLSLLFVSFLWKQEILLFFALMVLSIIIIYIGTNKKREIKMYLLSGSMGVLAESFAVFHGAWIYSQHFNIINIPLWLFPLWGIASIFLVHFYEDIMNTSK